MQINNLKIKFNRVYQKWDVVSPYGRILEEFNTKPDAEKCARGITDFVKIGGRVQQ